MKADLKLRHLKTVFIASGICTVTGLVILLILGASGQLVDWLIWLILFVCADFLIVFLCVHVKTRQNVSRNKVERIKKLQEEKDEKIDECMRDLEQQLETIEELNSAVEGATADNARLEKEVEGEKHVHQRTVEELRETGLRHKDLQSRAKGHYEKLYEELLDANQEISEENEAIREKMRLLQEQLATRNSVPAPSVSEGRQTEVPFVGSLPLRPTVCFKESLDDSHKEQISDLQRQTADKDKEIDNLVQSRIKLENEIAYLKDAAVKTQTHDSELAMELAEARKQLSQLKAQGKAESGGSSSSSSSCGSSGSASSHEAENPLESTAASSIAASPEKSKDIDSKIMGSLKLELAETKQREEESRQIATKLEHEKARLQEELNVLLAQNEQLFRRMGAQEDEEKALLLNESKEKIVKVALCQEKETLLQSKVREALNIVRRARSKAQEDNRAKEVITARQGLMGQLFKKQGWHVFDDVEEQTPESFFKNLCDDEENNASLQSKSAKALSSTSRSVPAPPESASISVSARMRGLGFEPAQRVTDRTKERSVGSLKSGASPAGAVKTIGDLASATPLSRPSSSASSSASFPASSTFGARDADKDTQEDASTTHLSAAPSTWAPRDISNDADLQEDDEREVHRKKATEKQAMSKDVVATEASKPSVGERSASPSGSGSSNESGSESGSESSSGSSSGSSDSGSGSASGSHSSSHDSDGTGNSSVSDDYDLR